MSRVVLIGADAVLERQARRLLGDEVVVLAPASSDVLVSRLIWLDRRPELVILGGDMPPVLALWIARSVRDLTDSIAMVGDDPAVYEQSLASGVTDFLGTEVDLEELDALLTRTRDHAIRISGAHAPARSTATHLPGAVIAVTAPKGGVGKTTVATNVAIALQDSRGRSARGGAVSRSSTSTCSSETSPRRSGSRTGTASSTRSARPPPATASCSARSSLSTRAAFRCSPPPPHRRRPITWIPPVSGTCCVSSSPTSTTSWSTPHPDLDDATLAAIEQASAIVAIAGVDVPSTRGLRTALDMLRELQLEPPIRQIVSTR